MWVSVLFFSLPPLSLFPFPFLRYRCSNIRHCIIVRALLHAYSWQTTKICHRRSNRLAAETWDDQKGNGRSQITKKGQRCQMPAKSVFTSLLLIICFFFFFFWFSEEAECCTRSIKWCAKFSFSTRLVLRLWGDSKESKTNNNINNNNGAKQRRRGADDEAVNMKAK
ncbi:hypothetical protein ABB37_07362 [Leptomonas pyrrhocoris]|uniref:Uncharacterized protein n=1 Tax=Leptomonas pyrrhocoris TaxID=157538 RepID=A0A0M9FVY7_LEPPY|nr:hypothetical protein ABB37_07362 [Leptomonas pyrrhocoris]KPA77006.1 hypothetical protein ABB37_07362 [Leptomonas pyrrhocoris]|eukprot:XP_015655445.1 hypothetical protein ABB37_07362 [Leptomonas pyrrhocoris]